ncbi:hypothetical protein GTY83_00545 [Streptomyces sp. SID4928]|uniref:hypothetical protein n=1 Tax=Streptomyces TaxID=1883 RepID=UPI0001C1AAB7|nr:MULTISPECIES: hypothetical protein [Streptomyces]EGE39522.1 putative regulatory protein [Streptomyces sp. ACT-1]MYR47617.1 hypothetical protein [Streptomyces sp. SID4928]
MADQFENDIQSKYAQQYAADLATNRQKQSDLTAQIAGLRANLEKLKSEETWLTQAQGSLPSAAGPSEPAPGTPPAAHREVGEPAAEAPQTVPAQRHEEESEPEAKKASGRGKASKRTPAKKTAARKTAAKERSTSKASQKATTKKAAAKPGGGKAPAPVAETAESSAKRAAPQEKDGPTLWQLALGILLQTPGQPCVVREVTERLAAEHPERATSVQMVRAGLETLVKKRLAEKTRQQGNVMYTATPLTAAEPEGNASVGSEPVQADATDAETGKVPAEV